MVINKNLIHFQTKKSFDEAKEAGLILPTSICFIKETLQLYTHELLYDCKSLEELEKRLSEILDALLDPALIDDYAPTDATVLNEYYDGDSSNGKILLYKECYREFTEDDIPKDDVVIFPDEDPELEKVNFVIIPESNTLVEELNTITIEFPGNMVLFYENLRMPHAILENITTGTVYICQDVDRHAFYPTEGTAYDLKFIREGSILSNNPNEEETGEVPPITEGGIYVLTIRGIYKFNEDEKEITLAPITNIKYAHSGDIKSDIILEVDGKYYRHWDNEHEYKDSTGFNIGQLYKVLSDNTIYLGTADGLAEDFDMSKVLASVLGNIKESIKQINLPFNWSDSMGLVPNPGLSDEQLYLSNDGNWRPIENILKQIKFPEDEFWEKGSGQNSVQLKGLNNKATGDGAVAVGNLTSAIGLYSYSEGFNTQALNGAAHAEGAGSIASGTNSHSEGNKTTAKGQASHSEGQNTVAEGVSSHTEGEGTIAKGEASHAEGRWTLTNNIFEHAEGINNISIPSTVINAFGNDADIATLHSVGNGYTGSNRNLCHNAHEIKQDGTHYIPDMYAVKEDGTPYKYFEKPMINLLEKLKGHDDILFNSGGSTGDVILVNNHTLLKIAIKPYELEQYKETHTPIGIVVIPASHDVYGTGECGVMSLFSASLGTPDEGLSSNASMYWGLYNIDTRLPNFDKVARLGVMNSNLLDTVDGTSNSGYMPLMKSSMPKKFECPTDPGTWYYNDSSSVYGYIPSPYLVDGSRNPNYYMIDSPSSIENAMSDFAGKSNTELLLSLATALTNWKTIEPKSYKTSEGLQVRWEIQSGTWNENVELDAFDNKRFTCVSPGSNGFIKIRCIFKGNPNNLIIFKYRSDAESTYDYLMVGKLDTSIPSKSTSTSYAVATTSGKQKQWLSYIFNINDDKEHFVEFAFGKDGSTDTQPDNALIYIAEKIEEDVIQNLYSSGYSPAACACWRYHTIGTNQGDWYLPAMGELGYCASRFDEINTILSEISHVFGVSVCLLNTEQFLSSSEYNLSYSVNINFDTGKVNYESKKSECCARPFYKINIIKSENTIVKESGNIIKELTISNTESNVEIYNKSQIDDILKKRITWEDLFIVMRILPYIDSKRVWIGDLIEYDNIYPYNNDTIYIRLSYKDWGVDAILLGEEFLYIRNGKNYLLGLHVDGNTTQEWDYKYLDDPNTTHTISVTSDENGWFEYLFEKPLNYLFPNTSNRSCLSMILRLPILLGDLVLVANMFGGMSPKNSKNLKFLPSEGFSEAGAINMVDRFLADCQSLKSFNLLRINIGTTACGVFGYMKSIEEFIFPKCDKLSFYGTFSEDSNLKRVDLSKVKDYTNYWLLTFQNCSNLEEVIFSDTYTGVEAASCKQMFDGCSSLKKIDLSRWNPKKINTLSGGSKAEYMFRNCPAEIKFGDVTRFESLINGVSMFDTYKGETLDVSSFLFPVATNLSYFFSGASNVKSINMFNEAPVVTNVSRMFSSCLRLESINLKGLTFDQVTNISSLFRSCHELESITLNVNLENCTNTTDAFYQCEKLKDINGSISNIKKSISLSDSPRLTNDSAMVFINGLAEVETLETLTFHPDVYNQLSEEQIAIATSKGWSIASA